MNLLRTLQDQGYNDNIKLWAVNTVTSLLAGASMAFFVSDLNTKALEQNLPTLIRCVRGPCCSTGINSHCWASLIPPRPPCKQV